MILDEKEEILTIEYPLQRTGVSEEDYIKCLKVTCRGRTVILKQNPYDIYTIGCNQQLVSLWGANNGFQFVLDEYSTIMYVCGYMMKSEKAMGEVLKRVSKECRSEPTATLNLRKLVKHL